MRGPSHTSIRVYCWAQTLFVPLSAFVDVPVCMELCCCHSQDGFGTGSKKGRSKPLFVVAWSDDFLQSFVVFHSFERSRDVFEANFLCYEWGGVDTALPE